MDQCGTPPQAIIAPTQAHTAVPELVKIQATTIIEGIVEVDTTIVEET